MLSIIYSYRNRDLQRIKNSLNSLKNQSVQEFKVFFIDYGSDLKISDQVKMVCKEYSFVHFKYAYTQFQPWNKSRALNSIIKDLTTDFCFVADVDMIFHPKFIETAISLQEKELSVYFQVGYLDKNEKISTKVFHDFRNYKKSTKEATGLSMFPVKILQKLHGFDEFYHFWGSEDTDMHNRLRNAGYIVQYYDEKVLMLHQWHRSYMSSEIKTLTPTLQVNGIIQLNHQHLKFNKNNDIGKANKKCWGKLFNENECNELLVTQINMELDDTKAAIDHFLLVILPSLEGIHKIKIERNNFENSSKYKVKKLLNKKVPVFYSLKKINDLLLLHLIAYYRDKPYIIKISRNLEAIEFAIKK